MPPSTPYFGPDRTRDLGFGGPGIRKRRDGAEALSTGAGRIAAA